jgi:hypothetical protein
MKNKHIKPKEEVPTKLRLKIYKQVLEINWKTNEEGLCHLLPMFLWGFHEALDASKKIGHNFWDTKHMFPELTDELPKISRAHNENIVRCNALKRMIKKLEN